MTEKPWWQQKQSARAARAEWTGAHDLRTEYGWAERYGRSEPPWGFVDWDEGTIAVIDPAHLHRRHQLYPPMYRIMGSGRRLHSTMVYPLALTLVAVMLVVPHLPRDWWAGLIIAAGLVLGSLNQWLLKKRENHEAVRVVTNRAHQTALRELVELLHARHGVDLNRVLWEAAASPDRAIEQLYAARELARQLDRRLEIDSRWSALGAQAREAAQENQLREEAINENEKPD